MCKQAEKPRVNESLKTSRLTKNTHTQINRDTEKLYKVPHVITLIVSVTDTTTSFDATTNPPFVHE